MPDPDRSSVRPPGLADELFGGSADPAATGPIRAISERTVPVGSGAPEPSRRWPGRAAIVGVPVVLALVSAALWAGSQPEVIAGRASPADPPAVTVRTLPGLDLAARATRTDTDCAAHSYGRVQAFMAANPCLSVRRALYTGTESGQPVVVAVSTVEMASESDAAELQKLADTNGTGNVADLLRDGVTFEGAPSELHDASYASQRRGSVLVIVEAAVVSGAARPLDPLAQAALALGG
ncbi:MAG: hypothetical protein ACRDTE_15465 [Pseudonocardiaceae bacterium]